MAKRSPQRQNKHDSKVKKLAKELERNGWDVKADLRGYGRPDPIGKYGYIPDIQAKKAGAQKIIEVGTRDTLQEDREQHKAFRRSAGQQKRTKFEIELAD